jgi:DeoR/GlpR family transcriptional regulator of sugar metabolism
MEKNASAETMVTMKDASETALPPRQQRILEILDRDHSVAVQPLSEALGVSAVTIRSDLDSLERRRLLRRVRGGAMAVQSARFERPLDVPSQTFTEEKERIGALAASQLRSGETVILDAGTTTLAMAMALPRDLRDLMVITSSLDIAIALEDHPGAAVIVTGGSLKKTGRNLRSRSLVPPFACSLLEQVNADCAYLCCAGIDAQRGFTNAHFEEVEVKRAMLRAARRAVMLGDRGKIGHVAGARIATMREISTLITDRKAAPADVAALEAAGPQVILA